jgi:hypothetical protein
MTTTAQATGKIIQNGIGLSHLGKIWRILLMIVPAVSEIIRPRVNFLEITLIPMTSNVAIIGIVVAISAYSLHMPVEEPSTASLGDITRLV